MSSSTKLIWLSDLHFTANGLVQNHNPRERLAAAINHINAHHGDASLCVISGDIVDRGSAEDYAAVSRALSDLHCPYHALPGNHDNRALLREHMPIPENCMDDFVQYSVITDDAVLLCLDTHHTGYDDGEFCEKRFAWLGAKLEEYADQPVILFFHHPPMSLGLPMQDTDLMKEGAEFLDFLEGHNNVAHICMGHVHRPISGSIRGIGFTTMRAVLYQAPPPRPSWDWSTFEPGREAPNIGVMYIKGRDVLIQYDQFCDYETGVEG